MNQVSNFPYLKKKLSFDYFILWVWLMSALKHSFKNQNWFGLFIGN